MGNKLEEETVQDAGLGVFCAVAGGPETSLTPASSHPVLERFDVQKRRGRLYSTGEEIGNAVSHGVGFGLAVAALVLLCVKAAHTGGGLRTCAAVMMGVTLVLEYLFSTLYHAIQAPRGKAVLRILDHSVNRRPHRRAHRVLCSPAPAQVGLCPHLPGNGMVPCLQAAGTCDAPACRRHGAAHCRGPVVFGWLCLLCAETHSILTYGVSLLCVGRQCLPYFGSAAFCVLTSADASALSACMHVLLSRNLWRSAFSYGHRLIHPSCIRSHLGERLLLHVGDGVGQREQAVARS